MKKWQISVNFSFLTYP